MDRRRRFAALCLIAGLWGWGNPDARAGGILYTWGPLYGNGWSDNYPENNDFQTFSTDDGSLTIYWDPCAAIPDSTITASSGPAGYSVTAYTDLEWFEPNVLTAIGVDGQSVFIDFSGDPGPIVPGGQPESLAGFAGQPVYVSAMGGYHEEYGFNIHTLPEPSGLLLLPIGLVGIALGRIARRRKKRPAPDGYEAR